MALTDDEQSRLERISRTMQWDDPKLERALAEGRFRNRRLYVAGTSAAAVAVLTLSVALWFSQGMLILAAWLVFALGMLLRDLAD